MQEGKAHVLVEMFGLNIQDVKVFIGPKAEEQAEAAFEAHTNISYAEYQRRRDTGEDNNEVLREDEEGTEIYVVEPTVCE